MYKVRGGIPVGADGRVHTTFTHNPSTLRLSSVGPNLQQIPRGAGKEMHGWVKEMFVAPPGKVFWAADFVGIEAVLVGYFAESAAYYRLARLGVHAFFASHVLGRPADLSWSDSDLTAYFRTLKQEEDRVYNICKRCVHLSNYKGTPYRMFVEYPETFASMKDAKHYQDLYFDIFPEIPRWHERLCRQVDATRKEKEEEDPLLGLKTGVAHLRNPFGYLHRFYRVLSWSKVDGEWFWRFGDDAKSLIAFGPSSSAAGILKEAGLTLFEDHFDLVGHTLRLFIHDEILGEAEEEKVEEILHTVTAVMEAEQERFPLPPSWGQGDCLSIHVETKIGRSWGSMA